MASQFLEPIIEETEIQQVIARDSNRGYSLAFIIATFLANKFSRYINYDEEDFTHLQVVYFFENIVIQAISENHSPVFVLAYLEKWISIEDISPMILHSVAWQPIKREINVNMIKNVCRSQRFVTRIPCRCGVGEDHFFTTNNFYCDNGNLVYETIAREFLGGVYNINVEASFVDTMNSFRYARPPFRFISSGNEFYNIRTLVTSPDNDNDPMLVIEKREDVLEFYLFQYNFANYIPYVWRGHNPNENEQAYEEDYSSPAKRVCV